MLSSAIRYTARIVRAVCVFGSLSAIVLWASVGGSISGTVKDPSGSVVAGASVTVMEINTGLSHQTRTDSKGYYTFPVLPVGHYVLDVQASGFGEYKREGVVLDTNAALTLNASLEVGSVSQNVTVNDNTLHVETTSTQMGQVITGRQMTAVPLDGRSYTDLLSLQPGVAPATAITSSTVQDVGATILNPSGTLNPGNLSVNGQRETANYFSVNGSDVEEDVNAGTAVIPNLDAIAEFRIITSNFDAEYGEYSGGQISVITKSGSQRISRQCIRVSAQHRSRCAQLLLAHPRRFSAESIWRHYRRTDPPRQTFLLPRLSGHAADTGRRYRQHPRALER